jgi:non-ribosomal peptide synthetase component F
LNLPLDFSRPEVHSYKGDIFHFQLDKPKTDVLRALCGTEAATLFMMLLALCNILLSKLSGQEDITIGTVAAGRNHADLENTLGIFVNTIALRNYPSREKTFRQFLNHLKTRHLQVIENQDYPFEDLVEKVVKKRAMGRNPLFDVAFGLQDIHIPGLKIPGLTLEPYGVNSGISKFDMTWYGSDNGDRLNFSIEYRKELFKPGTIERFSNYFKEMAAAVAKNPDICLKDIVLSHDLYDHELDMTLRDDNDFGF